MLGAYALGKTSLGARYVEGVFSERYLSIVGVKIDRRDETVGERSVRMVLWDLQGRDEFQDVRSSYLRGAAAFVFVADGTRPDTLADALDLRDRTLREVGDVPGLLLLNKIDLGEAWELGDAVPDGVPEDLAVLRTSARTGENVAEAFRHLAAALLS